MAKGEENIPNNYKWYVDDTVKLFTVAIDTLTNKFSIFWKFKCKFNCLICEIFYVQDLQPTLNSQSGSIKYKLFV